MSRKYAVISCSVAVIIGAGYYSYKKTFENKGYTTLMMSETSTGAFLLNMYRSLHNDIKQLFSNGVRTDPIETNKINYSIFDAKQSSKDSERERLALPEFVVIPGISDSSKIRTYHSSINFDTWRRGHGDNYSGKYSRLDQINRQNVRDLSVAWVYRSGEGGWDQNVETNPVIADGTIFVTTPVGYLVAIDAVTGVEKWRNTFIQNPARRGLLWWPGNAKYGPRLFVPSNSGTYAVDPKDGQIIEGLWRCWQSRRTIARCASH